MGGSHHLISQAGWNRCNLSIYLSIFMRGSNHLISQAGWNRCNLIYHVSRYYAHVVAKSRTCITIQLARAGGVGMLEQTLRASAIPTSGCVVLLLGQLGERLVSDLRRQRVVSGWDGFCDLFRMADQKRERDITSVPASLAD